MIVGHRVVTEKRDAGGIRIRGKEVRGNTICNTLAVGSVSRRECQRIRQRSDVVLREVLKKSSTTISAAGRQTREKLVENWQRDAASTTRCKAGCGVASTRDSVALCIKEFLEESVLENIDFVEIIRAPYLYTAVGGIANFKGHVASNFALVTKRPLLHVRDAQVGIDGPQSIVRIRQEVLTISDWHRKGRRRQSNASRGQHASRSGICRRLNQARVGGAGTQRIAHDGKAVMQVAN